MPKRRSRLSPKQLSTVVVLALSSILLMLVSLVVIQNPQLLSPKAASTQKPVQVTVRPLGEVVVGKTTQFEVIANNEGVPISAVVLTGQANTTLAQASFLPMDQQPQGFRADDSRMNSKEFRISYRQTLDASSATEKYIWKGERVIARFQATAPVTGTFSYQITNGAALGPHSSNTNNLSLPITLSVTVLKKASASPSPVASGTPAASSRPRPTSYPIPTYYPRPTSSPRPGTYFRPSPYPKVSSSPRPKPLIPNPRVLHPSSQP